MERFFNSLLCGTAVVVIFPLIAGHGDEIQGSRTLFRPVNMDTADLHPETRQHLERIRKMASTAAPDTIRVVMLQPDELNGKTTTLRFTLPDGKTIMEKSGVQVVEKAEGGKTMTWANAENPRELVQLSCRGKSGTGLIYTGGKVYSVEPLAQGLHVIAQVDQSKFPKGHTKGFEEIEKRSEKKPREEEREVRFVLAKDSFVVRVLVAYTTAVEEARGGEEQTLSLIDAAIDLTNRSYINSKIGMKLQLASSVKVKYEEAGDLDKDLAIFRDMDDIKKQRKESKADICVLLVDSPAYTGVSASILADTSSAFSVIDHVAAVRFLSFPHEMGHLQGARHEDDMNHDLNYQDNHGYTVPGKEVVTMMAYPVKKEQIRILWWSSPDHKYAGIPLGTKERSNNARVLNDTAERTSKLRP